MAADRSPSPRRITLRGLGAAILAMVAVVVLPTEAWGATGSGTWSGYTTTLTASVDSGTGVLSYSINTSGSGDPGNQFRLVGRCGSTWVTSGTGPITAGSTWQTQPTYGGPKTGTYTSSQITTMCAGNGALTAVRVDIGSSPTYATATVSVTLAAATPSTCSTYTNARASYVGTTLTVMFGWSGTVPAGGWKVHAPGDGYTDPSTTAQAVVPRTRVSGAAEYEVAATVSGLTAGSTTVRVSSTASAGCYVVVTAGSVALVNGVPNQGADPTTGESCSSWDLFCQIRSAFTPSQSSLDNWSTLSAELGTVVPFGYISDALGMLGYLDDPCSLSTNCEQLTTGFCFDPGMGVGVTGPGGTGVCPFAAGTAVRSWMEDNRTLMATFAWAAVLVPLVAWVWRKSVPFINGGS